jgi:FkbM family methyltransferase
LSQFKKKIGFLKSKLIYDLKPFANSRLKQFYSQFVKSGDLCFDVGCHTGNRSNAWLKLNAKVVAFEPQPYFVLYLQNRFKANSNFTLISKGVGSKKGEMPLMISSLYPTISTFSNKWKDIVVSKLPGKVYDENLMVDITTLDEMITTYGMPRFCKIDVEGHEFEVLKGLTSPIPVLSFEFYSEEKESAMACLNKVDELGNYEFNWSVGESLKMQNEDWVSVEELEKNIRAFNESNSGDIYARIKN